MRSAIRRREDGLDAKRVKPRNSQDRIFILLPCPFIPHWLYCEAGAEGPEGLGEGRKIMLGRLLTNPRAVPGQGIGSGVWVRSGRALPPATPSADRR